MAGKHTIVITHVNLSQEFTESQRQSLLLIQALSTRKIQQRCIVRAGSILHRQSASISGLQVIAISKPFALSVMHARGTDLLHAHESGDSAYWCYLAYKLYGTPYVIHQRITTIPKNNRITRSIYAGATCIIALSRSIVEVLHSYQPELPVIRIPSMFDPGDIDEHTIEQLRQRYRGSYLIVHTGSLVDNHQGISCFIEAARRLVSRYPHMRFVFVGDGKDRKKLERQAQSIDQVDFVGFQLEARRYLAVCDQYVFPSLYEGLGTGIIDAMRFRLPIVASAVTGITDLIQDSVTGLLVPSQSPEELAEAITKIYTSSTLAAKLGQQAYRASNSYSPTNISERVFSVYQSSLTLRY